MYTERIAEFFYKRASKRIKEKIKQSRLSYEEIYFRDPKQISWIVNNTRGKNNKFLICDAVIENYGADGSIGLLPKLDFKSKQEILWGDKEEILSYLPKLFEVIWEELPKEMIDKELYLCDYIPYAKYNTYWEILFHSTYSNKHYPALLYGIDECDVISSREPSKKNAIGHLYKKCSKRFTEIFFQFAAATDSFHMIPKKLEMNFIESLFLPMLDTVKPDESSLGLRVKNLIIADLSQSAELILGIKPSNEEIRSLIYASSKYIVELEKIHEKIEGY